jgi:uncharacterized pyridoxal phosphate-containing UPF0001 family protein
VELAANLADVRASLADACVRAGRDVADVTLVAVTKTWPATDVLHLAALGVSDVGENRDQEAAPKVAQVQAAGVGVRWHFVGQLQRNKARSVARYSSLIHSVDSVRLARALADAARPDAPLSVLVQVNLDPAAHAGGGKSDPEAGGRGGALPDVDDPETGLDRVLAAVAGRAELVLCGLMAVAPPQLEPERAFAEFARIADRIRQTYPDARILSAGMSGDFAEAIAYGATHVRLGSALLGNRPPLM